MAAEKVTEHGYTFREVLREELRQIELSRGLRRQPDVNPAAEGSACGFVTPECREDSTDTQAPDNEVYEQAHRAQLAGLAFSGGGIRSATFNLGVLQALAELKLLHLFDYLSTVSGGGYIGCWFTAWIRRRGFKTVENELYTQKIAGSKYEEQPAIEFLRKYSNYLTPELGLSSADTWTFIATYLRNLSLNLTVLNLFLLAVFLLPHLLVWVVYIQFDQFRQSPDSVFAAALLLLGEALFFIHLNLAYQPVNGGRSPWYTRQGHILWVIVAPIIFAALLGSFWLWFFPVHYGNNLWMLLFYALLAGAVYFVSSFFGWLTASLTNMDNKRIAAATPVTGEPRSSTRITREHTTAWEKIRGMLALSREEKAANLFYVLVSFAAVMLFMWGIAAVLNQWSQTAISNIWYIVTFGMPLMVLLFMVAVTLHIGLMGRDFPDERREWWSRLGGWQFIIIIVWLGFFCFAIYGPVILIETAGIGTALLGSSWLLPSIAGILAGKSPLTGKKGSKSSLELVAKVAPYVFIIGLLLLLSLLSFGIFTVWSFGISKYMTEFGEVVNKYILHLSFRDQLNVNLTLMNDNLNIMLLYLFLGSLGTAIALSIRVDINQFSMHLLYRNRLTRCYLGASNPNRNPQPFTGFDPADDPYLGEFGSDRHQQSNESYQGPYQIINAALNLVGGKELAWQQRKAASFVFTPRFSGYELPLTQNDLRTAGKVEGCYRQTAEYGGTGGGIQLGEAMAISGAAASPNMGYHSSPALAFLLTIFNVRLGWWCGNTRDRKAWKKGTPTFGLWYLLKELFGLTSSESKYVYLSDGGHFENLGIYELVRRRCRFIVACDAGQDGDLTFEDLGNAIRKCYTDLGVEIEIDVSPIRLQGEKRHSQWHCAVGTIHYEKTDQHAAPGTLIYLKPSLTGQEPADILEYASHHPDFPHQSTADQWFDEAQFESYRKLGYHVATTTFGAANTESRDARDDLAALKEQLFTALRQTWYPPSQAVEASFSRHSKTLSDIYGEIRLDANLKFLDAQIYPEWEQLSAALPHGPFRLWLPDSFEELRSGFYICNAMIQLLENVYLDLNLVKDYDHPDNRGWMNLFRHWSWAGMFRLTWAVSACNYGARFQSFCEQHLDLTIGDVGVDEKSIGEAMAAGELNPVELRLIKESLGERFSPGKNVCLLQILAGDAQLDSAEAPSLVKFTFGIALLDPNNQIVYFRVRDHLRKMGLARKGLVKLLQKKAIARDIRLVEPQVSKVISTISQERFERLLRSVMYELQSQR